MAGPEHTLQPDPDPERLRYPRCHAPVSVMRTAQVGAWFHLRAGGRAGPVGKDAAPGAEWRAKRPLT